MPLTALIAFLRLEASAGLLLVGAAVLALIAANSALAGFYDQTFATHVTLAYGDLRLDKPLLLWINDGLMAVFFLLVGLEIKREALEGDLSSPDRLALPGLAALGGMVVPAALYLLVNAHDPALARGWAIPAATDIAFALGILALLGPRVPLSLKILLTALAILDDLGAIVIIALFYSADLSTTALGFAGVCVGALIALNRLGVRALTPYMLLGAVLWVAVLKSGVHATLAGVVLALAIPLRAGEGQGSPSRHLEHVLHPWVAFGILPLFAFANAGVSLEGVSLDRLLAPVPLGILLGLVVGKQVGVMVFSWLGIRTGLARLPEGATWAQFYGVALLTGIGFTMSLFVGTLAFGESPERATDVRVGVLAGSLLSGVLGYAWLRLTSRVPGKA
ncbi:Na+/H+ antiporter NhaA [Pararhodospirillum oryzae]|uniref:Na(+)/H(+) antiporter NhaA n=1 Tax=Pararhodospirillum oryzae TaxID=478448 RepID=A0A512H3C7_9PROT|nr:Na+/H+ antiporter NhaA [Pararhodospirillum oryzae]GEO79969.1 Na(+)/H(+) antiporter NhaA [Pararhodospirillum oryzae]